MSQKIIASLNVMVVDDEAAIRKTILRLLEELFPEIQVLATAGSVGEAMLELEEHNPNLLFLDVELPDGTGFDLLEKIQGRDFRVIFITAHQEYALAAIKVSALDYILKPIDPTEFRQAVEKAASLFDREEEKIKLAALAENLGEKKVLKRLILPTYGNLHVVRIKDIIRAEADSNYTTFWLKAGEHIMVSRTIKEFEELLSGSGMIRVHQSHLVNIEYIEKYSKRDGGYLILKDKTPIPVSKALRKKVLEAIQHYLYL